MDFILFVVIVATLIAAVVEWNDSGSWGTPQTLACCVLAPLVIWSIVILSTGRTVTAFETYKIYTLNHGENLTTQVYFDTSGNVHNVTEELGFLLPEGSVMQRRMMDRWICGCYCLMGPRSEDEYLIPDDNGELINVKNKMKGIFTK